MKKYTKYFSIFVAFALALTQLSVSVLPTLASNEPSAQTFEGVRVSVDDNVLTETTPLNDLDNVKIALDVAYTGKSEDTLAITLPKTLAVKDLETTPLYKDKDVVGSYTVKDGVVNVTILDEQSGNVVVNLEGVYEQSKNPVGSMTFTAKNREFFVRFAIVEEPKGGNEPVEVPGAEKPTTDDPTTEKPETSKPETVVEQPAVEKLEVVVEQPKEEPVVNKPALIQKAPRKVIPIETPIITSIRITHFVDGVEVPVDANNPVPLDKDVNIYFEWELPEGLVVNPGDTYEFDLPKDFKIYSEIIDALGEYGDLVITRDGHVTMTFNELAATGNSDGVHGTIEVHTILNKDEIDGETEQVIEFPVGGGIDVPIVVKPEKGSAIEKAGSMPSYNGKEAHWTIDVNKTLDTLEGAKVTDTLPASMKYKPGSVVVRELKVNIDGTVVEGDIIPASEYTVVETANGLTVEFKNTINKAYRIEFDSIVTENDLQGTVSYKNNAQLTTDNGKDGSTSAVVPSRYGKPLEKSVKGPDENYVSQWTVNYNHNLANVDGKLTDALSDPNFEYIPSSFKVYEITFDKDGNEILGDLITVTPTITPANGTTPASFELNLGNTDKAYKIVYETKPVDGFVVSGNIQLNNTVISGGNTGGSGTQIGQNVLDKGIVELDIDSNFVRWRLEINKQGYEMKNLVIEDNFHGEPNDFKGMTMSGDDIKIVGKTSGKTYVKGVDYDITFTDNNGLHTGFKVVFKPSVTIDEPLTVEYVTEFLLDDNGSPVDQYINNAHINWDDSNGSHHETIDIEKFPLPQEAKDNGKKIGTYDPLTKQITWTIYINYSKPFPQLLRGTTMSDTISPNQTYVDGSMRMFEYTRDASGVITDIDGDLDPSYFEVDVVGNEVNVEVLRDRQAGHVAFQFKTSVEGTTIEAKYENTASVGYPDGSTSSLEGELSITNGGKILEKNGKQNGEDIDWTLNINFSQSEIQKAVIEDKPSSNQRVMFETIKIVGTTVDAKGNVTVDPTKVLVEGVDYDLTIVDDNATGEQSFKIEFKFTLKEPYVLTYSAHLDVTENGEKVSNGVTITGVNTENVTGGGTPEIVIEWSTGGGTGTGYRGSIVVNKKDDKGALLDGVVFELYKEDNRTLWRGPVTTENGKAVFGNLTKGIYYLREVSGLPGHFVDPELATGKRIEVVNSSANAPENVLELDAINARMSATLIKSHKNLDTGVINPVAGAVYSLYKFDGSRYDPNATTTLIGDYTTDANGQINVSDLFAGDYYFIEKSVPVGSVFVLNDIKIYFTLKVNAQGVGSAVTVRADNFLGRAILRKADESGTKLQGVTFKLVKVNTDGTETTVKSGLKTNQFGAIALNDLAPGKYYAQETDALPGFVLNPKKLEFEILNHYEGMPPMMAIGDLVNYKGQLEIIKLDDAGSPLANATFVVTAEDGTEYTLVTDADGKATVDGLAPGSYTLKETVAPAGYVVDETVHEFEIVAESDVKPVVSFNNLINYKGAVKFLKTDTASNPLAGAVYTVTDSQGQSWDVTTDASGLGVLSGLEPGDYTLVEKVAPKDFILDPTVHTFTIPASSSSIPVVDLGSYENAQGSMTLKKENGSNLALAGAEFTLTHDDGTVYGPVVTDASGVGTITGLKPGHYTFVETKAPVGYIIDPTVREFDIVATSTTAVVADMGVLINAQGSLTFMKVDKLQTPLQGAEFTLTHEDGTTNVITTGANGVGSLDGLKPGAYTLVETKAPAGYVLDPTIHEFTIVASSATPVLVDLGAFVNLKGSLTFKKVDAKQTPLKGAEFTLTHEDGTSQTVVTDDTGVVVINDLKPGKYQLVETKAPTDYILDPTVHEFTVAASSDKPVVVDLGSLQNLQGALQFVKTDDGKGVLKDATFTLTHADGTVVTIVTDANGVGRAENLKPGKYQLVETKAPVGYALDPTVHTFEVPAVSARPVVIDLNDLINYQGEVQFRKVDEQKNPLANAEFKLTHEDGTSQIIVTDASGVGRGLYLKPGNYELVEVKAPSGYVLSDKVYTFTIAETSKEKVLVDLGDIVNVRIPDEESLPGAGMGSNYIGYAVLGAGAVLTGLSALVKKRKEKE